MSDAAAPPNPLLAPTGLPRFADFRAEHVVPGVRAMLAEQRAALAELEANAAPTWAGVVLPLERIHDRIHFVWGLVSHQMNVRNTPELRAAHQEVQPEVIELSMALEQSRPIHDALQALADAPDFARLDAGQRRAVECLLRDAKLAGVALDGEPKERFNALQRELAELSTRFSNNTLDATKAFWLDLASEDEVAGLPPSLRALAASEHPDEGATAEKGPWRITLAFPSFGPFMSHAKRRDLREQVYRAYFTRASSGEHDNTPLVREILRKKRALARLLGYGTYAELSLASKMARDVGAVETLLEELRVVALPAAERDLAELEAFARAHGQSEPLARWDMTFWAERMREQRFDYTDEELRPYFPLPRVLEGLFDLTERLFGVRVRAAQGKAATWHPDVLYFEVLNGDGTPRAAFFLDAYARSADKRGGAWMDDCLGRTTAHGGVRLPVAYLTCNFTPPLAGKPAQLSFDEVLTLFHEFGHGLQHMLTQVDHGLVAGIANVEWDAVELPSQFMENWCYHRATVLGFSGHVDTGEPLPDALFEKLVAARTFREGTALLRQLDFGLTDLELHHRYDPDGAESPEDVMLRIREKTAVGPAFAEDRYLNTFGHIFAGGYAAGYYSYKWAEVLSADAFAAFEEEGLEHEAALADVGRRFAETVLALGGSVAPMEVFKAFRGREPSTEALLRHAGLAPSA
ncbi:MAG: M3 family metallopeptidase [Planctomycetes bacterium]|nr:M3 family metallopeptidase [Planctomycetota bacterium]